ncbi:hypothetical protein JCM14076_01640 [Methylosoma difficile]
MFKLVRILILLCILAWAAFYTKIQHVQARSWSETLPVVIYPINADDGSVLVDDYISSLEDPHFAAIDTFIQQQSQDYDLIAEQPTLTHLGEKLDELPPEPPLSGNPLDVILWSLQLRHWVWQNTPDDESNLHRVRIFVLYHEAQKGRHLQHSLGIDNGLVAIVHAFAADKQTQQNNVVIAHELLHTVGATDKYNTNNEPLYPSGYANPEQDPLYPQELAEIMAGRIPLSQSQSQMPANLNQCVIGAQTAAEINWHI